MRYALDNMGLVGMIAPEEYKETARSALRSSQKPSVRSYLTNQNEDRHHQANLTQ